MLRIISLRISAKLNETARFSPAPILPCGLSQGQSRGADASRARIMRLAPSLVQLTDHQDKCVCMGVGGAIFAASTFCMRCHRSDNDA
ncbi:hypothetical protein TgHK011_007160 [Trichoderma gracile]|nr:hypothetical protein TgHK011_007160 [Trichoderma gracile]